MLWSASFRPPQLHGDGELSERDRDSSSDLFGRGKKMPIADRGTRPCLGAKRISFFPNEARSCAQA